MKSLLKFFSVIALFLTLTSQGCDDKNGTTLSSPDANTNVEKTKEKKYSTKWSEVEKLANKGLYKSADSLVQTIYKKAVSEKNHSEQLRCMSTQMDLASLLNEDAWPAQYALINAYENRSAYPLKNIIRVEKAKFLQGSNNWYYRNHTANNDENDPRLWNISKRKEEVNKIFDLALNDHKEILVATKLSTYNLAFIKMESVVEEITPTIYHFIANEYISFMENNRYEYGTFLEEDASILLMTANEFLNTDFSKNQIENKYVVELLSVFQQVEKVNQIQKNGFSSEWFTLKRLDLLKTQFQNQSLENKYWEVLSELAQKSTFKPIRLEVERMKILNDYNSIDDSISNDEKKIKLSEIIRRSEEHKTACSVYPYMRTNQWIVDEIKSEIVELGVEEMNAVNKPILVHLKVKNLSKLNYSIYSVEIDPLTGNKKRLNKITDKSLAIPDRGDFQYINTEFLTDALPKGYYELVLDSSDKIKENNKSVFFYSSSWIVSSVGKRMIFNDFVTGTPIADLNVSIQSRNWSSEKNKYIIEKYGEQKTDSNGEVKISSSTYSTFVIVDDLYIPANQRSWYTGTQLKVEPTIVGDLYTDRGAYRPGQRVFFKGIVKQFESVQKGNVVANEKVKIELFDVNGQSVKSFEGTTNTFGSVEGYFDLPFSGLNGTYSLRLSGKDQLSTHQISVLEYKKPKILIEWPTALKAYTLKETNTVKGIAKTYSGVPIANLAVDYTVSENRFMYYRRGIPFNEDTEWSGTVKTNDKGEFEIVLKVDDTKDVSQLSYSISVSAIDVSGEVVTSSTSIDISKAEFNIEIATENVWNKDNSSFKVNTKSSNRISIPAKGEYVIYQLVKAKTNIYSRLWSAPKQSLISESDFNKWYGYLDYTQKEDKVDSIKVKEGQWISSQEVVIDNKNWMDGEYVIVATAKDKNGVDVKGEKTIQLERKGNVISDNVLYIQHKQSLKLGQDLTFDVTSKIAKGSLLVELYDGATLLSTQLKTIENGKVSVSYKVPEKLNQLLEIRVSLIQNGRLFLASDKIVPESKIPELMVEWISFRDKITPNAKEEWKLQVKDKKGNPVAAEVLLSMYDISIDQFMRNSFDWNAVGFDYYLENRSLNFRSSSIYVSLLNSKKGNDKGLDFMSLTPQLKYSVQTNAGGSFVTARFDNNRVRSSKVVLGVNLETSPMVQSDDDSATRLDEDFIESPVEGPNSLRDNLQELAFFFPQIKTDNKGVAKIDFTAPQALTTWRVMGLAYTKDLGYSIFEKSTVTQKDLMVEITAPRFVREGDVFYLSARVSNTTDKVMPVDVKLELFDLTTNKSLSEPFSLNEASQKASLIAGGSQVIEWKVTVPTMLSTVGVRVLAKGGAFSDGEQISLPILSSKTMVTSTLPFLLNEKGDKTIDFSSLIPSSDFANLSLTLDYVQNPLWHVLMALPNVIDKSEQQSLNISNQLVVLAALDKILSQNPSISNVLNTWKARGASALLSELEHNSELKQIILKETPWVMNAQSQEERKKYLADLITAVNTLDQAKASWTLLNSQLVFSDALVGWSWCKGMPSNVYISKNILMNLERMQQLNPTFYSAVVNKEVVNNVMHYVLTNELIRFNAIKDVKVRESYDDINLYLLTLQNKGDWSKYASLTKVLEQNAMKNWTARTKNAMLTVGKIAQLKGSVIANEIKASLKQSAIVTKDRGTFWPNGSTLQGVNYGDVATQAKAIDFLKADADAKTLVEGAQLWLLLNKRANDWGNNYSSTEAIYGLMISTDWSTSSSIDIIKQNGKQIITDKAEAASGYINVGLSSPTTSIVISKSNSNVSFGTVYAQYLIDIDKVESTQTGLKITKTLYRFEKSKDGKGDFNKVKLDANTVLKQGERVYVEIKLEVDREMEFLQVKDYRAAGMEPVDQQSRYYNSGGLSAYKDVKDVNVQFSIDHVQRGSYVIGYELFVAKKGEYSNGYAMVQSAFNPEMIAYSKGSRVKIVE